MTTVLSFFADDDELTAPEARLEAASKGGRAPVLLALAWQLRQRDTTRATALAEAAKELLAAGQASEPLQQAARLLLLRGEEDWLFARLEAARQRADEALQAFAALHDPIGQADSHWLQAMLAIDQGDWPAKDTALEAMARVADGHDPVRVDVARAAQAYFEVFRDLRPAQARWGAALAGGQAGRHPASGCWAEDFLAVLAYQSSDFAVAIRHFVAAFTLALLSGQSRRAVIAATNTGAALNHLNDYQAALEWMQRGLDLARQTAFPGVLAVALLQTAHTLRLLNRLDASREMLHEALALMAPLAGSRNHAYALWHLGEVELAAGHWAQALATFRTLAERADMLKQPDLQGHARCGAARSLLALGEPQAALAAAEAALALGRGVANREVAALQVMAEVHAAASLHAPPGLLAPSVPLHYLQQALALAGGIEGLTLPAGLLQAAAREHARLGDFQAAYGLSQQADASRQATHNQEASVVLRSVWNLSANSLE